MNEGIDKDQVDGSTNIDKDQVDGSTSIVEELQQVLNRYSAESPSG